MYLQLPLHLVIMMFGAFLRLLFPHVLINHQVLRPIHVKKENKFLFLTTRNTVIRTGLSSYSEARFLRISTVQQLEFKVNQKPHLFFKYSSLYRKGFQYVFRFIYRLVRKKGYFKVNSKILENSRNHLLYILTVLGLVLQNVFQLGQISHRNSSEISAWWVPNSSCVLISDMIPSRNLI